MPAMNRAVGTRQVRAHNPISRHQPSTAYHSTTCELYCPGFVVDCDLQLATFNIQLFNAMRFRNSHTLMNVL